FAGGATLAAQLTAARGLSPGAYVGQGQAAATLSVERPLSAAFVGAGGLNPVLTREVPLGAIEAQGGSTWTSSLVIARQMGGTFTGRTTWVVAVNVERPILVSLVGGASL